MNACMKAGTDGYENNQKLLNTPRISTIFIVG